MGVPDGGVLAKHLTRNLTKRLTIFGRPLPASPEGRSLKRLAT